MGAGNAFQLSLTIFIFASEERASESINILSVKENILKEVSHRISISTFSETPPIWMFLYPLSLAIQQVCKASY